MASAETEIRHVFGATCLTEGSIGAAPPDIVKLSGPDWSPLQVVTTDPKCDTKLATMSFTPLI